MVPLAADLVLMAPQYAGLARDLPGGRGHTALGAAVLVELGLLGRVSVRPGEKGRVARVEVHGEPDGLAPLLGERLGRIESGVELTDRLLALLAWQLPQQLCAEMAQLGLTVTDDQGGRRARACLPAAGHAVPPRGRRPPREGHPQRTLRGPRARRSRRPARCARRDHRRGPVAGHDRQGDSASGAHAQSRPAGRPCLARGARSLHGDGTGGLLPHLSVSGGRSG